MLINADLSSKEKNVFIRRGAAGHYGLTITIYKQREQSRLQDQKSTQHLWSIPKYQKINPFLASCPLQQMLGPLRRRLFPNPWTVMSPNLRQNCWPTKSNSPYLRTW